MRREFIVERSGKSFCLYAGLLDMAHSHGLKSLVTSIAQIPGPDNNQTAICQATAVLVGDDGVERVFTGIGDASPANVAPAMLTCLLRMAETRAKARALRDAVNIGVAAFEETGEEEGDSEGRGYGARPVRQATRGAAPQGKCPECGTQGRFHRPGCSRAEVAA